MIQAPINYPCVMIEKEITQGQHLTKEIVTANTYILITSEKDFKNFAPVFKEPAITYYYDIVREVISIYNLDNLYF